MVREVDGRHGAHDRLLAPRPHADDAHRHAHELLDEPHVIAGRGREFLEPGRRLDLLTPTGQGLVDRPHLVHHRLVVRNVVVTGAVGSLVTDADLQLGEWRENVELGEREFGAGVEPHGVLEHHQVEPPGAPAPLGVGAELGAAIDEQVADRVALEQFGRERSAADPGGVRLHETDDAVDRPRSDPRARAHAARNRIARGHERIGAVVEVEEGGLGALEEHPLLRVERLVYEVHRVVDERFESRHEGEIALGKLFRVDRQAVVDLGEHAVLLAQRQVELLAKDLGVEVPGRREAPPQARADHAAHRGANLIVRSGFHVDLEPEVPAPSAAAAAPFEHEATQPMRVDFASLDLPDLSLPDVDLSVAAPAPVVAPPPPAPAPPPPPSGKRRKKDARDVLWIEVKAAGGRLRPEQQRFRELHYETNVAHVVGALDDVLAWLVSHGYVKGR